MDKKRRDETKETIGQIMGLVGKLDALRQAEQQEYDALKADYKAAKQESQWRPPAKRLKKSAETLNKKFAAPAKSNGATAQRAAKPSPPGNAGNSGKPGGLAKLVARVRRPQGAKE